MQLSAVIEDAPSAGPVLGAKGRKDRQEFLLHEVCAPGRELHLHTHGSVRDGSQAEQTGGNGEGGCPGLQESWRPLWIACGEEGTSGNEGRVCASMCM